MDDDDGFQDFLSEGEEDSALQMQEAAAVERRLRSLGIRDGLEFGKEDTLQEGFDAGFAAAAARSHRFGVLRGMLSAALACGLFNGASDADTAAAWALVSTLRALAMQTAAAPPSQGGRVGLTESEQAAEAAVASACALLRSIHVPIPEL